MADTQKQQKSNQRQDPAETKEVDTAVQTEEQPPKSDVDPHGAVAANVGYSKKFSPQPQGVEVSPEQPAQEEQSDKG